MSHWLLALIILGEFILLNIAFLLGLYMYSWLAKSSYGGTIVVQTNPEGKLIYSLVVDTDLDELQYRNEILFKIKTDVRE